MARFVRALLLVLLAFIASGCAKRGDPADAAKAFFQHLAAGDADQAYGSAAFGFQAQQTAKSFTQTVKELGLGQQDALAWERPEVTGDEATVNVEITAKDGGRQRFVITLVFESGAWRVHSLRSPRDGSGTRTENRFTLVGKGSAFSDAQNLPMPDEAEIRKLASTVMLKFSESLEQKSFAGFYQEVSAAWQKQLTIGQLERAFQPFITNEVRISDVRSAELHLDSPPTIGSEGILHLNGHFRTAPYRVYFSMKFVYELPRWKLFGLDVNLQQ